MASLTAFPHIDLEACLPICICPYCYGLDNSEMQLEMTDYFRQITRHSMLHSAHWLISQLETCKHKQHRSATSFQTFSQTSSNRFAPALLFRHRSSAAHAVPFSKASEAFHTAPVKISRSLPHQKSYQRSARNAARQTVKGFKLSEGHLGFRRQICN